MIDLASLATSLLQGASTTTTTVAKSSSSGGGSILDPIAKPIAWVLAEIYSVVPNYGVAILILSVLWMLLISPLTLKSTRSMLAMQKLQPQLKRLQDQHKNDRQAFAQAQMDLFREHQVSPFGSCLPMLLPMPIFFALFRVIDGLSHTVKGPDASINCYTSRCYDPKYLSTTSKMWQDIVHAHGQLQAFGMNLADNAFSAHSSVASALPFWIALLVMAGTSYLQTSMMMSRNQSSVQNNPQMRMMRFLPLIFVVFCIRFPAGVILYYSMSNVCRIVQQDAMYRLDPRVKALVAQEVEEVEAMTQAIDRGGPEEGGKGSGKGGSPPPKGGGGAPKGGPSSNGQKAGSGRSRFGDLLATASEQQKKGHANQPPAKSAGSGGPSTRANGAATRNGAGGGSRSKARAGGHKTNRKRRRR